MAGVRALLDRLFAHAAPAVGAGQSAGSSQQRPDRQAQDQAYRQFLRSYPAYGSTLPLDALRATEYARLDQQGHTYLDYTGGSLYATSQLREHAALLAEHVYGNPHSHNLTSRAMTSLVERARARVLGYFNAAPDEYTLIFTPNATGALKLVGESFPFAPDATLLLTADNHNSVNGIREFARARGATVRYIPLDPADLRIDERAVAAALAAARPGANQLFAYPAQSNFTGVQHPLAWIDQAQEQGWLVLLDAAAFVPTNRLDLARWKPDFVDLSFYKLFGYPTGLGCLLVRNHALPKLRRPWYAGGTLTFSSVVGDGHYLTPGAAGFEDGTVNYLSIPAVELGLDVLERAGLETVQTRVRCLTGWLLAQLGGLRHSNGRPVVRLYGPVGTERRGGTVQLNFLDRDGTMYDCYGVEQLANQRTISLRAGCHCNPGAREAALGLTATDLAPCFREQEQLSYAEFLRAIEGKTTGALRASLGIASNFADVYTYMQFARSFVDRSADTVTAAQQTDIVAAEGQDRSPRAGVAGNKHAAPDRHVAEQPTRRQRTADPQHIG